MNESIDVASSARTARIASYALAAATAEARTQLLVTMAQTLRAARERILLANTQDCERERTRLSAAMLDRLLLNEERFESMVQGLERIAESADPVGECLDTWTRPNGLVIEQRRVPIGVVAVLYESRPNVTADAAAICIRSGNVPILKGGSEAIETNTAIAACLEEAAQACGFPEGTVCFLPLRDRSAVSTLLSLEESIDLVIPRGGEGLIRAVSEQSRIPVLKHYKGVCHLYVDAAADIEKSLRVVENAKVQRPGVCNALETLLVHSDLAETFLTALDATIPQVEIRGCERTCAQIPRAIAAVEEDWAAEYLALVLSVKVVDSLDAALSHIAQYGSRHTDGILSEDSSVVAEFCSRVDTGVVVCNASTRFNDGGEFGKGAEIGISTDKLHARGPVGAKELTTYKYIVTGSGTIR